MALLYMDGFDAGDVGLKWIVAGGTTASSTTRFSSGHSAQMPGGGSNPSMSKTLSASHSRLFLGFAYRQNLNDSITFLNLYDSGGTSRLAVTSLYPEIRVSAGSLTVTSNAAGLQANYWYHLEIGVYFAASGGTLEIRLNGVTLASDTGATGAVTVNRLLFSTGGSFWQNSWVDDLYVCNETGSAPYNTFLGDTRIVTLRPTAAGSSTQLTPDTGSNYARVNETPYSAANYVSGSTPSLRDTYIMGDLPANVASIYAVQNNVIAKRTSTGAIAVKPAIKSGASVYYGTTSAVTTNDATYTDLRITDPNTATAWTVGGVNAIESGLEIA